MPNRIYCEMKPELIMEGSMDKGSFTGDTIQETQPIYEEVKYPAIYSIMRLATSAFRSSAHMPVSVAAVPEQQGSARPDCVQTDHGYILPSVAPVVFWSIAVNIAHIAWAEINFKKHTDLL